MMKPVVNIADIELSPRPAAYAPPESMNERYGGVRMGMIGRAIGARKLGCNVTAVPPGRRAFPFHNHRVNEEMFFVLEGTGEVRIGSETHPIRAGDIVACPPGGPETAHQIVNTGESELKYLAVSTMVTPEIAEYPDSGKFGVLAEFAGEGGAPPTFFRFVSRADAGLGYWEDN
ncbi:cupin domain-containing protein [Trinickia caryophylli]